ncbi:MAG: TRAP transporter substrate-binding protein DctP [Alphaproteobacteria bacterium]
MTTLRTRGLTIAVVALAGTISIANGATAKSLANQWLDGEIPYTGPKITYSGPTITIRHSHFIGEAAAVDGPNHVKMMKRIEKDTGGKLKIRVYWQNSLADATRGAFDAVSSGVADQSQCYPLFDPSRFNLWMGLQLPNLVDSGTRASRILTEMYPKYLRAEYEAQNVYVSKVMSVPSNYLLTKDRQIKVPADVSGRKLWAVGDIPTRAAKAVGAVPVPLPPQDLYLSFQSGVIDIAQMHDAGVALFRLIELTKFRTVVDMQANTVPVCMNKKVFDDLPPDLKEYYYRTMQIWNHAEAEPYFEDFAAEVRADMEKRGIKSYVPEGEEKAQWTKAFAPIEAAWVAEMEAKGVKGAADMLAAFRKRNEELKKISWDDMFKLAAEQPVDGLISSYSLPPR